MKQWATRLLQPLVMALSPEHAHALVIKGLKYFPPCSAPPDDPALSIEVLGQTFSNPLGMAAGFDKNGEIFEALYGLGFSFVEIGTVTPYPQAGNPAPRIFRVPNQKALINRLGFNNVGYQDLHQRLSAQSRTTRSGLLGINLGANKDSTDRIRDYVQGIQLFSPFVDYFTLNISSPNTEGLRHLQQKESLQNLLCCVQEARAAASFSRPVLIKISPDLSLWELDDIIQVARAAPIEGLIVANTTVSRASMNFSSAVKEEGGLSGKPLFALSTYLLAEAYLRVENQFPLIGVGGIHDGESAYEKIKAGASLLQIYTGLVYRSLELVEEIKTYILRKLRHDRYSQLHQAVGQGAEEWTSIKLLKD